jgi:hypothetical protein
MGVAARVWAGVAVALLSSWNTRSAAAQERDSTATLSIRISLSVRQLWVLSAAGDTLLTASVAVGSGQTLVGEDRSWRFETPIGVTRVTAKQKDPLWVPPDWHYIEIAREGGLALARLSPDTPVVLSGGRTLLVRGNRVGIWATADPVFRPLIATEEIVFDGTLFIPPFGTEHRRIPGVLGAYRLLLANGAGLHGTSAPESIGKAVTHGCIRLRDDAMAWLYENVPVGTLVVIY